VRHRQRHRHGAVDRARQHLPAVDVHQCGQRHFAITNVNSGTVLDSANCGIFDGTITDLWSSLGNLCQEWDVTAVGSHYTISNVANGMVLDAVDCETADGTVVRQWAQLDNTCQQWDIKP
jgi:hypothetical protein